MSSRIKPWLSGKMTNVKTNIGNYVKNIYLDYKMSLMDTCKDAVENPTRASIYIGALGVLWVLYKTNPKEKDFQESITVAANEMLLIGKNICNPKSEAYLSSVQEASREKRIRYINLLFFSLIYFDTSSSDAFNFASKCKLLKPQWTEFHKQVADVGIFNRFIYLQKAMVDYDVNTDEWTEDGKPKNPVKLSRLVQTK